MFKKPFSFEGRIRRKEYGFTAIIYVVAASIFNIAASAFPFDNAFVFVKLIAFAVYICVIYLQLAQGAKRCHDIGNNGWWQIIPFYFLVLLFKEGDEGSNEYGDNPKADSTDNMIDSIGQKDY